MREGDIFVVTKLDRLACSVAHLVEIGTRYVEATLCMTNGDEVSGVVHADALAKLAAKLKDNAA